MNATQDFINIHASKSYAEQYAKARPSYPEEMHDRIISHCKTLSENGEFKFRVALDVGCGTGLSTVPLAPHFDKVIGVDLSPGQIAQAQELCQLDNITFQEAKGEDLSAFADQSVDLVTVGTALHFMDISKTVAEIQRVLTPGGAVAIYVYSFCIMPTEGAQRAHNEFYQTLFDAGCIGRVSGQSPKYDELMSSFRNVVRYSDLNSKVMYSLKGYLDVLYTFSPLQKYIKLNPQSDIMEILQNRLHESIQNDDPSEAVMETIYPIPLTIGTL